jgi:NCS2 family nucleobase:cation symporter-2
LANATGVQSRQVAYAIGIVLALLAFFPKLGVIFYIMPKPVVGAALIFSSSFMIVNGLEIMTSRLLDPRKTLIIGLALVIGLAVDIFPALFQGLPAELRAVTGTPLVLGTIVALSLNIIFRIGVRKVETLTVPLDSQNPTMVQDFIEKQGAIWGARREVIEKAKFNLAQSVETIVESCGPQGPLEIRATFDEFSLDVRISYTGAPMVLPTERPTRSEIIASDEGTRALAGFLLRRMADRVSTSHSAGRSTLLFHFDH